MKTSKPVRPRISNRPTLKNLNPVFHKRDKSEDNDAIPAIMIKQARGSGTLNLSGRGLAIVPDKIFAINEPDKDTPVTLESLSIKEEDAWWNQVALQSLDLSSNRLTQLSPKISQLDTLTTLMLYDNSLTSIPKEIAKLEKLNRLNLSRNRLKELPAEFFTLPELRYLNISYNEFEDLHPDISDLHMLEVLDASNNKLETVPCGIGFLVRLTEFYLSHNKIKELPRDIVDMRCLQKLDLMHNELANLPKDIGSLRKLQCLYVQHNNVLELPTFEGCQELKELHISDNFIERIPRRLCVNLIHLTIFDIRDNKLKYLPEEIALLKNLTRFDISNNSITQLPTSLGHLPHLVSLQVEGNPIKAIRRDILQCGTARILKTLRDRTVNEPLVTSSTRDINTQTSKTSQISQKVESPKTSPTSETSNESGGGGGGRQRTETESSDEAIYKMPSDGLNSPRHTGGAIGEDNAFPDKYQMRQSHCLNATMRNLTEVPDEIFQVAAEEYVTCLDFSKNQLKTLPKGLSSMFNCASELVFANNALTELPTFLSQFKHITMINVSCNFLKDLPKELGLLNTLRELNINNNRFDHIPPCVYDLSSLEILLARDNQISNIDATSEGLGALKRLATLDLGNNNIDQVPPILGNLKNLRSLELIGNPFRQPRHQILQKGTDAIMSYLRDRIPN